MLEKVFYRASNDFGLEENDPVVRCRIAQKMEFLMEPEPGQIARTGVGLVQHLADFAERFRELAG